MDNRFYSNDRKDENVVVEELTAIPEDEMVTVQEEVITTVNEDSSNVIVMDEGQAPTEEKKKLTLKPKPKSEIPHKRKRSKSEKKKSKGPKRLSAYILFSRYHRPELMEEFPGLRMVDITSKIAAKWSSLTAAEKEYWKKQEEEENAKLPQEPIVKKKKKRRALLPPPPDKAPEPLDIAAHLKLLGDSILKMGEITGEIYDKSDYNELTLSALLTNLLDCLICATAPLLYLSSSIDQINCIPEERQIKMLDNIAYIMPGLENFKV